MLDKLRLVRSRDHPHAAILLGHVADRKPGGHPVMRLQPDIARVLVPADEALRLGLLDEQGRAGDVDVGPDQILHGIEDPAVMRNRVQYRKDVMRVVAARTLHHLAVVGLGRLQRAADRRHLVGIEDVDRRDIAVAVIGGLLRARQSFRHCLHIPVACLSPRECPSPAPAVKSYQTGCRATSRDGEFRLALRFG